nr:LysR family transcriptional regulator [Pseudomonas sp.]
IVPVCTPEYAASHRITAPADLTRATLLHQIKSDAWPDMFDHLKLQRTHSHGGLRFDQYAMVIEATLSGLGVAAIPNFLIESDLEEGRLMRLFDVSVQSRYAYYLVYPEAKRNWKSIKAFRRWIVAEARHSEQKNRI